LAFTLLFVVSTVTPTNVIYTLSLHDALPIWNGKGRHQAGEKSACRPATAVLRLVHGISLIVFVMCPPGSTSRRCPSDGYPREVAMLPGVIRDGAMHGAAIVPYQDLVLAPPYAAGEVEP